MAGISEAIIILTSHQIGILKQRLIRPRNIYSTRYNQSNPTISTLMVGNSSPPPAGALGSAPRVRDNSRHWPLLEMYEWRRCCGATTGCGAASPSSSTIIGVARLLRW